MQRRREIFIHSGPQLFSSSDIRSKIHHRSFQQFVEERFTSSYFILRGQVVVSATEGLRINNGKHTMPNHRNSYHRRCRHRHHCYYCYHVVCDGCSGCQNEYT